MFIILCSSFPFLHFHKNFLSKIIIDRSFFIYWQFFDNILESLRPNEFQTRYNFFQTRINLTLLRNPLLLHLCHLTHKLELFIQFPNNFLSLFPLFFFNIFKLLMSVYKKLKYFCKWNYDIRCLERYWSDFTNYLFFLFLAMKSCFACWISSSFFFDNERNSDDSWIFDKCKLVLFREISVSFFNRLALI